MRDTRAIRLCTKPVAETARTLIIIAAIVSLAMSSHSSSTPTSSAEDQRSSDAPVAAGCATLPNRLLGFQVAGPAVLLLAMFIGTAQPTFASSDDAAIPLSIPPINDVKAHADSKVSVSLKLDFEEVQRSLDRVQHADSFRTAYRVQREGLLPIDRVALRMLPWQDDAAETSDPGKVAQAEEPANDGQDFTRPLTRFDLRFQVNKISGDATAYITTLRVDKPFFLNGGKDGILSLRVDLPLVYSDAVGRDNPNGDNEFGTGDSLTQLVYIPPAPASQNLPWNAMGFGVQLLWPTASKDMMGNEQYVAAPLAAVKFDMPQISEGSFLILVYRHFFDYANYSGGDMRDDIHEIAISPTLHISTRDTDLPFDFVDFWSGNDIRINLENGSAKDRGDVFIPFDIMFGKMINKSTVASIEFATPIYHSDDYDLYDWKVEFRIGFFF